MELIDGVKVKQLRLLADERGWLMEILRSDDGEFFEKFGQVYVTVCNPGVYKAWHYHKLQDDHFCCVKGMAKVVLYDGRKDSKTNGMINEFHIGELNPTLLRIPKNVIHGFTAIGNEAASIINVPTEVYNYKEPDELRLPYDTKDVPYEWKVRHG